MDPAVRRLIEALHAGPAHYVLAVTGGGTGAAAQLLEVPGGSRTVLEVIVPYHEQALSAFLGHAPEHYCSVETAWLMAERARQRAAWLLPRHLVVGVGCTASLATDRPKRGDHRFHIAVETRLDVRDYSLILTKGARSRSAEEAVLDAVLLNALAEALEINDRLAVPFLPGEQVEAHCLPRGDLLVALIRGECSTVCVAIDGRERADEPKPDLVLPGSFNPLHAGHRQLAKVAGEILGKPAAFELSIRNVDKPPLPPEEVEHRVGQFTWNAELWLTRAPTFLEKAELFPGATFAVGSDTAVRIVDPRYYDGSVEKMTAALGQIRELGCRFLVAGRMDAAGNFVGHEHLGLPKVACDLFTGIPESAFRADISSTQLRSSSGG